jgi:hypothetical protein
MKDWLLTALTFFAYVSIITLLTYHHVGNVKMDESNVEQACKFVRKLIRLRSKHSDFLDRTIYFTGKRNRSTVHYAI